MTQKLVPIPGMRKFNLEIAAERRNQLRKWGPQAHANGTGVDIVDRYVRDDAIHQCQNAAADGNLTWRLILAEEIAEAFAEEDPERLRYELVQSASVIQAWISDLDSKDKKTQ